MNLLYRLTLRWLLGAALLLLPFSAIEAQRGGGRTIIPDLNRIDQAEGRERLASFRGQRLEGDYVFRFTLTHLPRRGERFHYEGIMWGSWNALGPVSRVRLSSTDGEPIREWIIQNGPTPAAWVKDPSDGVFRLLDGAEIYEPLVEGLEHSVFDLQMPFLFWEDFDYTGPTRVNGRPAQRFMMYPNDPDVFMHPSMDRVRLALDDGYDALLRVDFYEGARATASLRVRRFREVAGQWIVREIDLVNERTRDRTQFTVDSAALNILLPEQTFDSETATDPVLPPRDFFEAL